MRPLAIAVVMAGVVLLALGTWLILRASLGAPRARKATPPVPRVANRPRAAVPFPPAAAARTAAPPVSDEDVAWQRPTPSAAGDRLAEPTLAGADLFDDETPPAPADLVEPGPAGPARPDGFPAEPPVPGTHPAGDDTTTSADPVPADDRLTEPPVAGADLREDDTRPATPGDPTDGAHPVGGETTPAPDQPLAEPTLAGAHPVRDDTTPAPQPSTADAARAAGDDTTSGADERRAEPSVAGAHLHVDETAPGDTAEAVAESPAAQERPPSVEPTLAGAHRVDPTGEAAADEPADEPPSTPIDLPAGAAAWGTPAAGAPGDDAGGGRPATGEGAAAADETRPVRDDRDRMAPRSRFAESLAAQAEDPHQGAGAAPHGDAVMPMGTVLGGAADHPPLPPPAAPPTDDDRDPFADWAQERPAPSGHQVGPVVDQQGPLPDLGATPGQPAEDDWAARFGALAEQLGESRPEPPADQPWPSRQDPRPDETPPADRPPTPPTWLRPEQASRDRRDEPFGRPYGQEPGPGPPDRRPYGPEPERRRPEPETGARPGSGGAARSPGMRPHQGRPEDPRQAAVYDALTINEHVLDEVWTSPSVDVLKVVSSIVVNALDAYEDDPAEYADWVAVHRTGNCDCH
jgi:hypothetical protein